MSLASRVKSIAIIGGGNIGTQFACVCASKGFRVTLCSSKPHLVDRMFRIVDSRGTCICSGQIDIISDDIRVAMEADVVFVTYPAHKLPELGKRMLPFVKPGVLLGVAPGTGGAEFAFKECVDAGAVLFGLQRVPAVARLVEYGKTVRVEGKRDALYLAAMPSAYSQEIAPFVADLFDMPCYALPNYLCVTMTPSNPILHTSRLATLFEDYVDGKIYAENPLFYGDWSDESSKRLLACDSEHQSILKKLSELDLSSIKSLVVHYDNSDTPEKMTAKIRSISSLHNLRSPMTETQGGFALDFSSRYFAADFPFGLAIIEDFAAVVGVQAPVIKTTMDWYRSVSGNKTRFSIAQHGLHSVEAICRYYQR